jgi:hypothetical protein
LIVDIVHIEGRSMTRLHNDRLLLITRLVLTVLMVLTIVAAFAALATLPILAFKYDQVAADLAASDISAESIPSIVALLLGGVA